MVRPSQSASSFRFHSLHEQLALSQSQEGIDLQSGSSAAGEPGRDEQETCLLQKGDVTVTPDGGEPVLPDVNYVGGRG